MLLLSLLATALPLQAEAACGGVERAAAKRSPATNGRAPLAIGDSTSLFAVPKFARLGIEANAKGCRQFNEGVDMLSQLRKQRRLPYVVVIALGANGPVQGSQITRALKIIGEDRVLALVTPPKSGASASAMRRAARRKPNRVLLIDWARTSSRHGNWFSGDGLHVGHNGAAAFARIIKRAISPYAFARVKKLRLPKSAEESELCGRVHRGKRRFKVYIVRGDERSTCEGAMTVAKRPMMRRNGRWRFYDLRAAKSGPWEWAHLEPSRKVLIAVTK